MPAAGPCPPQGLAHPTPSVSVHGTGARDPVSRQRHQRSAHRTRPAEPARASLPSAGGPGQRALVGKVGHDGAQPLPPHVLQGRVAVMEYTVSLKRSLRRPYLPHSTEETLELVHGKQSGKVHVILALRVNPRTLELIHCVDIAAKNRSLCDIEEEQRASP